MTLSDLFNILDIDKNGELSRSELHESARHLGWHWHEAPVLAVLDLFSVLEPISRDNFIIYMSQIIEDPHGPFGKVLLNSPHFLPAAPSRRTGVIKQKTADVHNRLKANDKTHSDTISFLKEIADPDIARRHQDFLENLNAEELKIPIDKAAVLIIDPQRSFTEGTWMKSIGSKAELEVKPIQWAFERCARFLNENYGFIETMFTRCPFPSESYDWDDVFTGIIDPQQLYFIKPGNSVLFPNTNGFREWAENVINKNKKILVIGGCTLNSCVRVSSIETQKYFQARQFQIVVDLSLCGARTSSFTPSLLYGGMSAVESAVREMIDAGVQVTQCARWI
ncbi:EF-hand domain-containing protein [Thermodesulfobacteriota bacterium]